ncbi:MAG: hypothetical protein ABI340_08595 [Nitrososphaera sp.]|jgi:hypothetical protein
MNSSMATYPGNIDFVELCEDVLRSNKNIRDVVIIDKHGRPFEKKSKTNLIHKEKSEMLFMERALEISMGRDFDDDFGKINYTFTERDNLSMFSFPMNEFIVLVTSKSNISPISVARKISSLLRYYKNFNKDKPSKIEIQI